MLNATLSDAGRKALRVQDLVVVPHADTFPVSLVVGTGAGYVHKHTSAGHRYDMALPSELHTSRKAPIIKAYIDPAAGGNTSKDRTAFSVVGMVGGNLILLSYGSVPGGYGEDLMRRLAKYLAPHKPSLVMIEKNMGHGAFKQVFQPILLEEAMKVGWNPGIEEELVRGQKELRIIETLGPILGRRSLWVTDRALHEESQYLDGVRGVDAVSYSLWNQMANITRQKNCLRHDDSIDSLAACCALFLEELAIDSNKMAEKIQGKAMLELEAKLLREDIEKHYNKGFRARGRKHGNRSLC